MTTSLKNSLAIVFLCLLAASAAYGQSVAPELNITLGEQRVKFAPTRSFQEMRLEVLNSVGEIVFTHLTTEAEFDWNLHAGNSETLVPGLYRYTLSLKFGADQTRQHTGHFIVEKGQDQVWLTASEGTEVSGTVLSASRSGGRSITGLGSKDDKSVKRDVSGREISDKVADSTKAVKQEKAALLGTANMVAKYDVGGVNLIDSTITEVGGNVGIGITTPTSILEMVRPGVTDVVFKMQNATRAWSVGVSGSGDFWRIRDNTAGFARLAVTGGTGLTGGNVGIGTTAPVAKLEVAGEIRMSAGPGAGDITGTNGLYPHSGTGDFLFFSGLPGLGINRMTIKNSGNVGIGTTAPSKKLVVSDSGNTGIRVETLTTGGTLASFGGNGRFDIDSNVGGGRMTVLENGRVGIRNNSPSVAQLHVEDDASVGTAIYGKANTVNGIGVWGEANLGNTSPYPIGVYGTTNNAVGKGVFGQSLSTTGVNYGVYGSTPSTSGDSTGVYGIATALSGGGVNGVKGVSNSTDGNGVWGEVTSATSGAWAIYGKATAPAVAGQFDGNVVVTGTLSKGGGSFKIDHPLDPENKYLFHSFVESPDMMNIYNGNVTTDASGEAEVTLPDWFDALNRDFRYQLTVIGQFAQAIVAEEIKDNRFKLKTSIPNVKVSWQVTGVRQDAFAKKHRIPVEELKPEGERGSYLHPEAFGKEEEQGMMWKLRPEAMKQSKAAREKTRRRVAGEEVEEEQAVPPGRPINQP